MLAEFIGKQQSFCADWSDDPDYREEIRLLLHNEGRVLCDFPERCKGNVCL
jgi:hypothetical protein